MMSNARLIRTIFTSFLFKRLKAKAHNMLWRPCTAYNTKYLHFIYTSTIIVVPV